jgi:hypothetical protein
MAVEAAGPGFPEPNFPTVFADGVLSFANNASVVKFFLARLEPNFAGNDTYRTQPFAQVVMPVDAFVNMVGFFQVAVDILVKQGFITQQKVDEHFASARGRAAGE